MDEPFDNATNSCYDVLSTWNNEAVALLSDFERLVFPTAQWST